jgi:hypothetical protein
MESGSVRVSGLRTAGVWAVAGSSIDFGAPLSLHEAADKTLSTIHLALEGDADEDTALIENVSILTFLRGGRLWCTERLRGLRSPNAKTVSALHFGQLSMSYQARQFRARTR